MNKFKLIIINVIITFVLFTLCIYGYEAYLEYTAYKNYQLNQMMTFDRNKLLRQEFEPQMTYLEEKKPSGDLIKLGRKLNFFPLGLQPSKNIILCDEGYGWVTYKTDRLGFRNSSNDWESFSHDVLLIGDSFTHGYCVHDGDDIAGTLRDNKRSVLNFGIGSYNPQHYSAIIQTFVKPLRPRNVVVVFYLGNDFRLYYPYDQNSQGKKNKGYVFDNDLNEFQLSSSAKAYFKKHHEVVEKVVKNELERFPGNKKQYAFDVRSYFRLKNIRLRLFDDGGNDSSVCVSDDCMDDAFLATKAALDSLRDYCNESLSCKPIIVLIGGDGGIGHNPEFEPLRKEFLKYINVYNSIGAGFTYLDMVDDIASLGVAAAPRRGAHLSVKGYNLVAKGILENLQ